MQSKFENKKCGTCGSDNSAHFVEWYSDQIPAGVEGFIGCRECQYWERVLSVSEAGSVLETKHWIVIETGQGSFSGSEERERTSTYRNPEADQYPRYGVGLR
jgi:hypothetical protein